MDELRIADDMIRLGQLLKLADVVDSGADAKPLIESGQVLVNGEAETRRGRQLHRGDVVNVAGREVRMA
ncbi:MAG: RNA-binding S4 domain-containing protein [Acidimicrobiales bacterium]